MTAGPLVSTNSVQPQALSLVPCDMLCNAAVVAQAKGAEFDSNEGAPANAGNVGIMTCSATTSSTCPPATKARVHETAVVLPLVLASPGGPCMVLPCCAVMPAPVVCTLSMAMTAQCV